MGNLSEQVWSRSTEPHHGYQDRNGRAPYRPDDPTIAVLRFPLDDPTTLTTPYGGPTPEDRATINGTADYPAPFTGNGFTASPEHRVPEHELARHTPLSDDAEIYHLHPDGTETLLAAFEPERRTWVCTPAGARHLTARQDHTPPAGADHASPPRH